MPNANGGVCISYTQGKRSYLVITDSLGRFTNFTGVAAVVDAANGLTWNIKGSRLKGNNRLRVAIVGTRAAPVVPVPAPAPPAPPGPDSGDLTITLSDSSGAIPPPVNPLPVEYLDDDIP